MKPINLRAQLCATAALLTLCTGGASFAQDAAALANQKAQVYSDQAAFAQTTRGSHRDSLVAALTSRGKSQATANSVVETRAFAGNGGMRHAVYEQKIGDLRVYGAYAKAAFDENGNLTHLIERLAPAGGKVARGTLDDAEALRIALDLNFGATVAAPGLASRNGAMATFNDAEFFHKAPYVERVVVARGDQLETGYLVETWRESDNALYHTVLDSIGAVVSNELRTANDSYNIFADHPGVSAQTVVQGPGAGNAQSPSGWLSPVTQGAVDILGNNVNAYLDRDNNNSSDGLGRIITNSSFVTTANLSQQPTTTQNQEVAVQNLFYLNNVIHDELYRHGFVEGAANFQENNFGKGGLGSDSVNAEAQDGGGTNNANFATPSDGSNPRMQMFLWTLTNPQRDGDLDSDIVWHEYGHGLTWRMIGSMSGNISGALGEGMSDVLAIIINDEDRVGEYSTNDPDGIRSSRYSLHQDTIGDFSAARGVHRNGEIIAATIWDMWTAYKGAGASRDNILDDIVGGMNFTPSAPDYFEIRDGILAQAPASRDCLIWAAFAARGMGVGGSMNSTGSVVTESFQVPSECGGNPPPPTGGVILNSVTASSQTNGRFRWDAIVTANVGNGSGGAGSGVVVSINTNVGASGSCTTGSTGSCSAILQRISNNTSSVTFTITALDGDNNADGVPQSATAFRP